MISKPKITVFSRAKLRKIDWNQNKTGQNGRLQIAPCTDGCITCTNVTSTHHNTTSYSSAIVIALYCTIFRVMLNN